jgi:hypothetical protein
LLRGKEGQAHGRWLEQNAGVAGSKIVTGKQKNQREGFSAESNPEM